MQNTTSNFNTENYPALMKRELRLSSLPKTNNQENLWGEVTIKETAETYIIPLLFSTGVFVGMALMIMSK